MESELKRLLSEPEKYADFQMLGDASEMFKVSHVQVSRYPAMPDKSRVRVSDINTTSTRKVCSFPDAGRC